MTVYIKRDRKVKQSIVLSFQIIQLGENDISSQQNTENAEAIDLKGQKQMWKIGKHK